MFESVYKNEQVDDKYEEGLVKLDDMLSMEENISDVKVDEQGDAQVEVDRAPVQASPPLTATKIKDEVCVDVHVDPVQSAQKPPVIDNVETKRWNERIGIGIIVPLEEGAPVRTYVTIHIFRHPDADWAIAIPYFCAFVMRRDVPFWPSNWGKVSCFLDRCRQ
nr:hypothetical protein [Tanacetum cinerariifolium]